MKTIKLTIKSGNYQAEVNGVLKDDVLADMVAKGVLHFAERDGLSKVFKGVAKRENVKFSADGAKTFSDKLKDALASKFKTLAVSPATPRVRTATPVATKAAEAYASAKEAALALGADEKLSEAMALNAARSHKADWTPGEVKEESFGGSTEAPAESEEKAVESGDATSA